MLGMDSYYTHSLVRTQLSSSGASSPVSSSSSSPFYSAASSPLFPSRPDMTSRTSSSTSISSHEPHRHHYHHRHHNSSKRRHSHRRPGLSFDRGLPIAPDRVPGYLLSSNPDLREALQELRQSAAHLQTLTVSGQQLHQPEEEHDAAWRARRRSSLGLDLERTDTFMEEAMEFNGDCIDKRFSDALRFSEWANEDKEMPEGLSSALDVLLADE